MVVWLHELTYIFLYNRQKLFECFNHYSTTYSIRRYNLKKIICKEKEEKITCLLVYLHMFVLVMNLNTLAHLLVVQLLSCKTVHAF